MLYQLETIIDHEYWQLFKLHSKQSLWFHSGISDVLKSVTTDGSNKKSYPSTWSMLTSISWKTKTKQHKTNQTKKPNSQYWKKKGFRYSSLAWS